MLETPVDLGNLQRLLDNSMAGAGEHLRGIITGERRLSAADLAGRLEGMRLLTVATVTATHLPGEELAVTVHGRAELLELRDPAGAELRQAMLDWYVPRQGPEFESWLDALDAVAARIEPAKMFTFSVQS